MLVDFYFGLGDGREWGWGRGWGEGRKKSRMRMRMGRTIKVQLDRKPTTTTKKTQEPEMKKCLESVFEMADVLFGLCFTVTSKPF